MLYLGFSVLWIIHILWIAFCIIGCIKLFYDYYLFRYSIDVYLGIIFLVYTGLAVFDGILSVQLFLSYL
ncbi:hypothetical protein 278BB001_231 [Bacillus phage 278BB001]|nr:hypothetical protein 278BB001_231 [Bacillus phage 278BB001]